MDITNIPLKDLFLKISDEELLDEVEKRHIYDFECDQLHFYDADDRHFEREFKERNLFSQQAELLRYGIEERDWAKIEEFAQKFKIDFSWVQRERTLKAA